MKEPILSKSDCLAIIEKRKAGVTLEEFKKEYFVCYKTIHKCMKHHELWEMFTESKHFQTILRLEKAIQLRLDGISTERILEELGYGDHDTLYMSLKRRNLFERFVNARIKNPHYDVKRGKTTYDIPIPYLKNRRELFGMSYRQIAKEFGCDKETVRTRCLRYNIKKADPETVKENRQLGALALEKTW